MNKNIKNALLLSAVMSVSGAWAAEEPTLNRKGSFANFSSLAEMKAASDADTLPEDLYSSTSKAGETAADQSQWEADLQSRRDMTHAYLNDAAGLGIKPKKWKDEDAVGKKALIGMDKPELKDMFVKDFIEDSYTNVRIDNSDPKAPRLRYTEAGIDDDKPITDADYSDAYKAYAKAAKDALEKRNKETKLHEKKHVAATAILAKADDLLADKAKRTAAYEAMSFNDEKKAQAKNDALAIGVTLNDPVSKADADLIQKLSAEVTSGHMTLAPATKALKGAKAGDVVKVDDLLNLKNDNLEDLWKVAPAAKDYLQKLMTERKQLRYDLAAALAAKKAGEPTPPPAGGGESTKKPDEEKLPTPAPEPAY